MYNEFSIQIFDVLKNERKYFLPFLPPFSTHIFSINGKLKNCRIFNSNVKWRIKSNDSICTNIFLRKNVSIVDINVVCLPSMEGISDEGIIVLDAHPYIPFNDGSSPEAKWTTITILGMNWMVKIEWLYNGYDSRLNLSPAIVVFVFVVVAGLVCRAMERTSYERLIHKKFHYR